MKSFQHDRIGYWSEVKLDVIKEYARSYTKILHNQPYIKNYIYIDAFAGAGKHISRRTGEFVPGSPLNALLVSPPFSEIHLIDLHTGKAKELRNLVGIHKNIHIYEADANDVLVSRIFPRCRFEDHNRGLCLLDPYALNVDWKVLEQAGKMKSIEIFYNFMIMDANMNVLWRRADGVESAQIERMDKVWGDRSWRDAAYQKQPGLFGDMEEKTGNEAVAEAFRQRLENVAGFKYVPKPIPMRNKKGAVVYYLYFASPNSTGEKIVKDIFNKYRQKGVN